MFADARSVTAYLIDVHRTGEKPTQNKDVDFMLFQGAALNIYSLLYTTEYNFFI